MRGLFLACLLALPGFALAEEPVQRIEVVIDGTESGLQGWIAEFRPRAMAAGISTETFDVAMATAHFLPDVVSKDQRQDEFTKTIWEYLDKAVSDDRIALGQKALKEQAAALDRIEATYGVDRQVVVAIWGLESSYGAVKGDIPTLSALATLAYDGRRAAFFEGELIEALKIIQTGDISAAEMKGSWAGAMGHTQFMPSSFQRLAVDFDGDGHRNIWGKSPADALASTAAYLAASGWKKGAPWAVEVTLPQGFDWLQVGSRTQRPMAQWAALGVATANGQALPDGWAALIAPAGARGPAFLVFDNFSAIETYNMADAYVFAVGHLADRLHGGKPFLGGWPRDLRALTYFERREIQQLLTDLGHDTGGVDAKMGPRTLAAIRAFQTARHDLPDGYPSLLVLESLRQASAAR
ncbi:lytic murein transglycosylase [Fuscibacter oryzae]|uniref:Lytic murein transglycosylase n=1 Tax=Fuscibacter oryzae TaxID=2803939 RepID=A0A8J7SU21_9RHOB|nr:lytic murein transglycosylase [Fuscibacter oryzae]MBL4929150.1 lytic murein transglycosylase [Fuscibacter oryzae]